MRASASCVVNSHMGCADAPLEQDSEVEAHAYEVGGGKLWKTRQCRVSAMWINGSGPVDPSQLLSRASVLDLGVGDVRFG
jgi:hypothetical protein